MSNQPAIGSAAPSFKNAPVVGGAYKPGATVSLADLKGQTVVLYFYPKDDTPGCTKQACALRDGWAEMAGKATVFGVSVDSPKSHEKFIEKHNLPFPLISDEDHQLVDAYGVWVEKSLYGNKYMGTERTTFVIGPDGRIKAVFPKIQPAKHFEKVLAAL
jgi:peroxiredoxin Q/BCP